MRKSRLVVVLPVVLVFLSAKAPVPEPQPGEIAGLASSLAERLAGRTVRLPDGSEIPIVAAEGQAGGAQPLLNATRLETCLDTISEAAAWPSAWLVVQDGTRDFDLVMHVRYGADRTIETPDVVFASPRREWDADALEQAVRAATGKKPPRERERNVVVQTFSTRIVTTYVYTPPKSGKEVGGLMAMLPAGAILRESRSVDLGDGKMHTIALALIDAKFVPSDCTSCAGLLFGNADSGRVIAVLAGEKALEDKLDLTPYLRGTSGQPLLPRYACRPGDSDPAEQEKSYEARFRDREPVRLLDLKDWNGDGLPLEFALPGEFLDCERHTMIIVGVDPSTAKLRVYGEKMERTGAAS